MTASPSAPTFREQCNTIVDAWQDGDLTFKDAIDKLQALKDQANAVDNQSDCGTAALSMGIINGYRGNLRDAALNFKQAREHFLADDNQDRVLTCDLNLGEVYRMRGNYNRALKYFHHAYELGGQLQREDTQTIALTNEGQLWISLNNLSKARDALARAATLSQTPWYDDETERQRTTRLDNRCEIEVALATICVKEHKHPDAWQHALAAAMLATQIQRPLRIGHAQRIMGDIITGMSNPPEDAPSDNPDYYYEAALNAFREIKSDGEVGKTQMAQGYSLAKRGKNRSAGQLFQQAMVTFTRLGMTDDAARAAAAQMEII